MSSWNGVAMFVDPFTRHYDRDLLFEPASATYGGDNIHGTWVYLREWLAERGVRVHTADLLLNGSVRAAKRNLYVSLGIWQRYRAVASRGDVTLSGFFALECPIVEPRLYEAAYEARTAFKRMFSFTSDQALRPFLPGPVGFRQIQLPQTYDSVHEGIWEQDRRGFLVMINANKLPRLYDRELYTERLRAVAFFNRFGEIDLYGVNWDAPPYRVGTTRVPGSLRRLHRHACVRLERRRPSRDPLRVAAREANRGPVASKSATLGRYTFAMCFENMVLEGWVTEKIFDCFVAGTVPVYLGAPDIESFVPTECFVDMRRFPSYDELRDHLRGLTPTAIRDYREAARDYLASERFRPFTKQALVERFAGMIEEDTGVQL